MTTLIRWTLLPALLLVAYWLDERDWRATRREADTNAWLQRTRELDGLRLE